MSHASWSKCNMTYIKTKDPNRYKTLNNQTIKNQ